MKIAFRFTINHPDSLINGDTIEDEFQLIMGEHSSYLFHQGKHIEYYSELSLADSMKYNETRYDGYIYGLVNAMNHGRDIFLFVNTNRMGGEIELKGKNRAICGFLAHEAGVHLANRIIERHITKKAGIGVSNDRWLYLDYKIDEETIATVGGELVEVLTDYFMSSFN